MQIQAISLHGLENNSKKINFETFVDTSVPETGLTDAKKINGLEYGWNEDVINIKITDAQDIEDSDPYGYFELPEYDEAKPKQFSISVKKGVSLPRYAYVDITIAASVEDSDGFSMADDIAYSFRTGNNKDDEPPIITDLSAGKRVTSSISILPSAFISTLCGTILAKKLKMQAGAPIMKCSFAMQLLIL